MVTKFEFKPIFIVVITFLRFTAADYLFGIFKLCDHCNIYLSKIYAADYLFGIFKLCKANITMVTKFEYTKEVIRSRKS
jgi:hypothetical protein